MAVLDLRGNGVQIGDYIDCRPGAEGVIVFFAPSFNKSATITKCPACSELGFKENEKMFIHLVQVVGNKLANGQVIPMLSVIKSCNPEEEKKDVPGVLQEAVS